jgi:hypothetical protein
LEIKTTLMEESVFVAKLAFAITIKRDSPRAIPNFCVWEGTLLRNTQQECVDVIGKNNSMLNFLAWVVCWIHN